MLGADYVPAACSPTLFAAAPARAAGNGLVEIAERVLELFIQAAFAT